MMSRKPEYTLDIKSTRSLKTNDFLAAVRLHCQLLPEYMPNKWGWLEPRTPFDPQQLQQLVFENGNVDDVWWRRSDKPKATGSWIKRYYLKNERNELLLTNATHSSIRIHVKDTQFQEKLLHYLKIASVENEADIGIIESIAEAYESLAILNDYAPYGGTLTLTTHTLRNWLPDMPWAVVFGSPYVRMFGKEKLLTTPAYHVEEIGAEMVLIQLTPRMEDIHEKYDEVMQARALAKQHLGEACFFKPELAYDYKSTKVSAEKTGKVFKVPEFVLIPD